MAHSLYISDSLPNMELTPQPLLLPVHCGNMTSAPSQQQDPVQEEVGHSLITVCVCVCACVHTTFHVSSSQCCKDRTYPASSQSTGEEERYTVHDSSTLSHATKTEVRTPTGVHTCWLLARGTDSAMSSCLNRYVFSIPSASRHLCEYVSGVQSSSERVRIS